MLENNRITLCGMINVGYVSDLTGNIVSMFHNNIYAVFIYYDKKGNFLNYQTNIPGN